MVVIAGVWGASAFRTAAFFWPPWGCGAGASTGAFVCYWGEERWKGRNGPMRGWHVLPFPEGMAPYVIWIPMYETAGSFVVIRIPLWIPWLLAAGFTVWRFRADRVKTPGLCPACGYDKSGLAPTAPLPRVRGAPEGLTPTPHAPFPPPCPQSCSSVSPRPW
jgi:hypothetical protein